MEANYPMNGKPDQWTENMEARVVHSYGNWNMGGPDSGPVDKHGSSSIVMIPTSTSTSTSTSTCNSNYSSNNDNDNEPAPRPIPSPINTSSTIAIASNDNEVQQYATAYPYAYGHRQLGITATASASLHVPYPNSSINTNSSPAAYLHQSTSGVDGCVPTSSNCPPMVRPRPPASHQQELLPKQMEDQQTNACLIRFKNYLNDWHHCLKNNVTEKWNRFVAHYYAPEAKRFCCHAAFQLQGQPSNNNRRNLEGRTTCCHCQMNSNKSQEVSFPELAIVFQHKFSEYKDERLLQFGQLNAKRSGNNCTTVFFFKHVVEVAETDQFIYLRKGPLAIQFKADLKILSWQFCMSSCEEVDRSHAIACSKLNQMLEKAGNCSRARGRRSEATQQTQKQPLMVNSTYGSTRTPWPQLVNATDMMLRASGSSSWPNALPLMNHPHPHPLPMSMTHDHDHVINARSLPLPGPSDIININNQLPKHQRGAASTNENTPATAAAPGHWHGIETSHTTWDSDEIQILETLLHSNANSASSASE